MIQLYVTLTSSKDRLNLSTAKGGIDSHVHLCAFCKATKPSVSGCSVLAAVTCASSRNLCRKSIDFKSTGIERQGFEELFWRTSSNSGVLARPSKNHVKNHQERSRGYRSTMACGLPRAGANKTGLTRDKRDTDLIHEAGGCPRFIFAAGVILSCQCCQSSCDENPQISPLDSYIWYTHSTVYNVLKFKQEGIKLIESFKTNSRLIRSYIGVLGSKSSKSSK